MIKQNLLMCSLNITDKFIETSLLLFHNNKFGKVGTRLRGKWVTQVLGGKIIN